MSYDIRILDPRPVFRARINVPPTEGAVDPRNWDVGVWEVYK